MRIEESTKTLLKAPATLLGVLGLILLLPAVMAFAAEGAEENTTLRIMAGVVMLSAPISCVTLFVADYMARKTGNDIWVALDTIVPGALIMLVICLGYFGGMTVAG